MRRDQYQVDRMAHIKRVLNLFNNKKKLITPVDDHQKSHNTLPTSPRRSVSIVPEKDDTFDEIEVKKNKQQKMRADLDIQRRLNQEKRMSLPNQPGAELPLLTKRYNRVRADFESEQTRNSRVHRALVSENQRFNQMFVAEKERQKKTLHDRERSGDKEAILQSMAEHEAE